MSSVMDKLCHAVETDDVVEAKLIICENEDIIDLNSQTWKHILLHYVAYASM